MPVGITEINAPPATFPIISSFDFDPTFSEMRLPTVEFVFLNRECHMQSAIASVTGNRAAGQNNRLRRSTLTKNQQNIAPGHRVSGQTVIAMDRRQSEHAFVEGTGTRHVCRVDCRFQDAIELWH